MAVDPFTDFGLGLAGDLPADAGGFGSDARLDGAHILDEAGTDLSAVAA